MTTIKIVRKWQGKGTFKDFMFGQDEKGNIYLKHIPCKATMSLVNTVKKRGKLINVYGCPVCNKIKRVPRHV